MPHSASGYGEIRIGRFYVVEMEKATETTDGKLSVTGQESSPPTTPAALVTFLHGQVVGMQEGKLVPVQFRDKVERNGYYSIGSASSDLTDYQSEVVLADWQIDLVRSGSDSEVDIQSRLTGAVRQNDFALTGTRWHAPAINHYAYHTGTSIPSGSVTRTSADGSIKVYLGVPSGVHPKWGCDVPDYYGGRVRITDTLEVATENEVEGVNRQISASGWSLSNGLINVTPSTSAGVVNVQYYDGSTWQNNLWKLQRNGANLAAFDTVNIIRNDFEECILRLTSTVSGGGRTSVDLKLKRGSRIIEGYMQTSVSTTLKVAPNNTTASTSGTGYQVATAGTHRPACGSARTFTVDNTNGGISRASTVVFDFWIGVVINAASPQIGDAVTDLRDQYIASMPELTYAVRR
jgi:hypothetical protein